MRPPVGFLTPLLMNLPVVIAREAKPTAAAEARALVAIRLDRFVALLLAMTEKKFIGGATQPYEVVSRLRMTG